MQLCLQVTFNHSYTLLLVRIQIDINLISVLFFGFQIRNCFAFVSERQDKPWNTETVYSMKNTKSRFGFFFSYNLPTHHRSLFEEKNADALVRFHKI